VFSDQLSCRGKPQIARVVQKRRTRKTNDDGDNSKMRHCLLSDKDTHILTHTCIKQMQMQDIEDMGLMTTMLGTYYIPR